MSNDLTYLGKSIRLPASPDETKLEAVRWQPPPYDAPTLRFTCPEFTSLCPVTGQPDFAHIIIDYIPDGYIIESKSLKLYLGSFRNHGAFHESVTMQIAERFMLEARPKWLRIAGIWFPRGGIPIDVFYQTGAPPEGAYIPDLDLKHFRGR